MLLHSVGRTVPFPLPQTQRGGNGRGDNLRVLERGEGNEEPPVGELAEEVRRDAPRQPCLPAAARTGQCYQAHLRSPQQLLKGRQLTYPADEGGGLFRQIVRRSLWRRRGGSGPHGPPRCRLHRCLLLAVEREDLEHPYQRVAVGDTMNPPLQVTDPPRAQARPLGQLLLGKADG